MSKLLVAILFLGSWLVQVLALPSGAPPTACVSMYPQHPGPNGPASAQTGLMVPFQIQVAAQDGGRTYKITVVRNANFPAQPPLLGFFLQVREPMSSDAPVGEFINLPTYAKYGDCGGQNTVTHTMNQPKPIDQGLEFYWTPANVPGSVKNLQVLGTFVQNMQTFWVKVPSQIFTVTTPAEEVPTTETVLNTFGAVTDVPPSINHHNGNVEGTNNDRRPGFGNSGASSLGTNPQNTFRPNNSASNFLAGLTTILTALLMAL